MVEQIPDIEIGLQNKNIERSVSRNISGKDEAICNLKLKLSSLSKILVVTVKIQVLKRSIFRHLY